MTVRNGVMRHAMSSSLTRHRAADNVGDMAPPRNRVRFADAARALLRDTLLDAASELLEEQTWSAIKMADIAKGAGVSRQTLYKEFGSREAFAQAYILRDAERFLADVERAITSHRDDPTAALAAAVEVFLLGAEAEPMIRAIVAGDDTDGLLALVTNQAGPVLGLAASRLGQIVSDNWPQVPARSVELFAQNVVRVAVSHAASPTDSAKQAANDVAEVFGPFLERVVGIP